MEQSQEKEGRSIGELLELLNQTQRGEALYDAFVETLDGIENRDVRADICLNTVKYVATQNATYRAKDKYDDEEVVKLFEEECQRFAKDLLSMPDTFRKWLKQTAGQRSMRGRANIVDIIIDACSCEHCMRFKRHAQADDSEKPTEPPPPPAAGEEAAS